jgi:hypothetical protein
MAGYNAPIENDKRAIGRRDSLLSNRLFAKFYSGKPLPVETVFAGIAEDYACPTATPLPGAPLLLGTQSSHLHRVAAA